MRHLFQQPALLFWNCLLSVRRLAVEKRCFRVLFTVCVQQTTGFYARHANSVRLSHACIVSKRLNVSSKFFHHLIGQSFWFFITKGDVRPQQGAKFNGGSNFRPMCGYISQSVIDRGIVILWKTNIKSYVLCRIVPLSMTLSDPEPQFQSQSIV